MNILVFSHEFPPQVGGAGVVADEYSRCLFNAGHDVTVLTQARTNVTYSSSYKVQQVKARKKLWFLYYRNALDFAEYDLIILNDVSSAFTAGLFFNKDLLAKSIMLLHGSEPETIFLKPSRYRRLVMFDRFYKRALDCVAAIVCVSNFMKSKFLSCTGLEHLENKMVVLRSFINHDVFFMQPDLLFRGSLRLPEDAFLLVTASRIVFGKGYLDKLKIFERLVSQNSRRFYWLIVGDGSDLRELKSIVSKSRFSDRVLFLGSMPREQLAKIYSNADLFWMLSNFEESLGLVYIEAQACGCPVLAKNAAGAREAVLSGKSGYLIDNEEQVIELFSSPDFLNFDKKDITSFAHSFNCESTIAFFEMLFRGKLQK